MAIDINLLGKRYIELTETAQIQDNSIIALFRIGQPELNRISWLNFQTNIELKKTKDFFNQTLINNGFVKWSQSQDKFVLNLLSEQDIPNLPANKINTGTFSIDRIPDLPISKITNLQNSLNQKEDSFSKGNVVSSTLQITNGNSRLVGSGNLIIDVDLSTISDFIRQGLEYYKTEDFEFEGNYTFTLTNTPLRKTVYLFHEGTKLGLRLDPSLYSLTGNTLTILTELDLGDVILVDYFYDDPIAPNSEATLQDVTNNGNVTSLPIIHAPAILPQQSVTLGQTLDLFVRKDIDDVKEGTLTLLDDLIVATKIIQPRSAEPETSTRRDELYMNYQQVVTDSGSVLVLLEQGAKEIIIQSATSIRGFSGGEEGRLVRVFNNGNTPIEAIDSDISVSEPQRISSGSNVFIGSKKFQDFLFTEGFWRVSNSIPDSGDVVFQRNTNEIRWDVNAFYGTFSNPRTGLLTENNTDAKLGKIAKIFYNGPDLDVPSTWNFGSSIIMFQPNVTCAIYVEYDNNGFKTANIIDYD